MPSHLPFQSLPRLMRTLAAISLLIATLLAPQLATSGTIRFSVDTHTIAGTSAVLSFGLVGAGTPPNTVLIQAFSAHGATATGGASGNVSGLLPGNVVLSDDGSFYSEATLAIPTLSTLLTFDLTTTATPSALGYLDALSLHLLDASGTAPLFPTTDPTGSGALFMLTLKASGIGGLAIYSAPGGEAVVSATPLQQALPEPSTTALTALGLAALLLCGRRHVLALGVFLAMGTAYAAEPLDAQMSVAKGAMVYNRVTDTFDTLVTITNHGALPVLGPVQLLVRDIATPGVAVYNAQGNDNDANALVAVPLETGLLPAGASATALIKFIDPEKAAISYSISVRGTPLTPERQAVLHVRTYESSDGDTRPAGPGIEVLVNGVRRGVTGADGTLTLLAETGAADIMARRAPTSVGLNAADLRAGGHASVDVLLDDDKEVYAQATLRIDQVRQKLLNAAFPAWTLHFVLPGERTAPLRDLAGADLYDVTGKSLGSLLPLLRLDTEGAIRPINVDALRTMLASKPGRLELEVRATDAAGAAYYGRVPFHIASRQVSGRITAPPSAPNFALGGVRLVATILNTDIVLSTVTAADGSFTLPALPNGNLKLEARTTRSGQLYRGAGVFQLNGDLRITLPLLAPSDPVSFATAGGHALQSAPTRSQLLERRQQPSLAARPTPLAATPDEASVSVSAAAEGVPVTDSASLHLPKGTKQATLTYIVASAEYPYWISIQSVFNDVWGVTVRADADGNVLFDQAMQVNSQLYLPPMWQADGSTGKLTRSFDVAKFTKDAPASLTLSAFATNVGDAYLATSVQAKLAASSSIDINAISAATDAWTAHNDGSYYGVPASGHTNTFHRRFDLDITKPDDVEVENVKVELLGAGDDATILDSAPGADAQWINDHTLRTIATFKTQASTVFTVPPPSNTIRYRFTLKAKDGEAKELEAEKTDVDKHPLWRMPASLSRFGGRDPGGDDWCSRAAYAWMEANAALLEAVNDVSGEHGKDLGHETHARGTDIDMYHFYRFAGADANSGTSNYQKLVARLQDLPKLTSPNPAVRAQGEHAREQIRAWINASRAGIHRLAALGTVSQVGYIRGGPGATGIAGADWGVVLLRTGIVTVQGNAYDMGTGAWSNAKYFPWPNHHHHVHVTLNLNN